MEFWHSRFLKCGQEEKHVQMPRGYYLCGFLNLWGQHGQREEGQTETRAKASSTHLPPRGPYPHDHQYYHHQLTHPSVFTPCFITFWSGVFLIPRNGSDCYHSIACIASFSFHKLRQIQGCSEEWLFCFFLFQQYY